MRIPLPAAVPIAVLILLPAALSAQAQPPGQTKETEAEFIKAAEAGAPDRISAQATIVRMEPKGQTAMVRQGSNGFTCFLMPDEIHTPVCTDQKGMSWFTAAAGDQPKPPTTGGVAFMAKGSQHYEDPDGRIVMHPGSGTKTVKEPPHWMLLTPLDTAATGIPAHPNAGGSYIMFAGTPYAHLMIHQDPKMLKP
jgi:hypothetical protein